MSSDELSTKKKIIIFDDDQDILDICAYVLEEMGWEVHVFPNCNNLIDTVTRIAPDVIFMDNWIPDEGGIVATQSLKTAEGLKEIPVVFFSANSDIQDLAKQARADAYLAKPFDLEALEVTLRTVVRR